MEAIIRLNFLIELQIFLELDNHIVNNRVSNPYPIAFLFCNRTLYLTTTPLFPKFSVYDTITTWITYWTLFLHHSNLRRRNWRQKTAPRRTRLFPPLPPRLTATELQFCKRTPAMWNRLARTA